METLVMIHSLLRWFVIAFGLLAVVGTILINRGNPFGWARQVGLVYTITLDIAVLTGLILWVAGGWWQGDRFYAYIHPLFMLLALGVAHMARKQEKRAIYLGQPAGSVIIFYVVSLGLIMMAIPWNR